MGNLFGELTREIAGVVKFEAFDHDRAWGSDVIIDRYGVTGLEGSRITDDQCRKFFTVDHMGKRKDLDLLSVDGVDIEAQYAYPAPMPKNIRSEHHIRGA